MNTPDVQRRLSVIFASDMVGYSRLMEHDEAGTLARLKAHRLELIDPTIARHGGRIVKSTGDGLLVEFASVVEAAEAARSIQTRMARRNADVPDDRRILFRIGIHMGDIIIEGDDVFGDSVNLAARLEQQADVGGICVSEAVKGQIAHKSGMRLEDMGQLQVKNISRPIQAYRLRFDDAETPQAPARPPQPPEQLSIAVLAFNNMSGDPEQEFFSDGLTEDIITALSRFRELTVISRNSTFALKGKPINVPEVARSLNVRYVVEGSVRKAGNRVRITVQLIDAKADAHVWAERYDRELADIFEIQDEVTSSIVATVVGRLEAAEHERVKRAIPENMQAYECVLAAKVLHHRSNRDENTKAREMIERAVASDPNYAHAHAWKACIIGQAYANGWASDPEAAIATVVDELAIALRLDENDSDVHRILAAVRAMQDQLDVAAHHQARALSLNPNDDLIVVQQGEILTWLGEPETGIEWIKRAMRLNPHHPERFWNHLGRAYFVARRYKDAIDAFRRISRMDKSHHAFLAAAHAMAGEPEAAAAHVKATLESDPGFLIATYMKTMHYKRQEDAEHHREALARAGFGD